jgi:small nuclear ribonucleoprotein (snRNP)-like protein
MMWIVLGVGCLAIVAGVLWVLAVRLRDGQTHDRIVAGIVRRQCIVTVKSGDSFRGVLTEADDRALVLTSVTILDDNVQFDGQLLLLRPDVAYIQLL